MPGASLIRQFSQPPGEVLASQNIALNFNSTKYADFKDNTFSFFVVNNLYIYMFISIYVEEIKYIYLWKNKEICLIFRIK